MNISRKGIFRNHSSLSEVKSKFVSEISTKLRQVYISRQCLECLHLIYYRKQLLLFFSEASRWSVILNPWIWLANDAHPSGPDFPIRTPRTDRSNPRENLKWNHFTPAQQNVGFFFLKWNFCLTNRCKVKRKISNGIKGLIILRKRRVFLCFSEL